MNKAITDGVQLMPPAFGAGLNVWSSGNGTPGSNTYQGAGNAAFVPADQDFGGCLELQKTQAVQRLRYMGQTPLEPGCYLRITARVKAVSGNLPAVRIAGYAGGSGGALPGVVTTGPATQLNGYGEIVEVSAIVGSGNRSGVDMVWGPLATFGHFGLDLTGQNGGVVRIDDIVIEDITGAFHRDLMNWVDVRDYGAVGDGLTDDSDAFERADNAAAGRRVIVSDGIFRLDQSVTINNRVEFEGRVVMPVGAILSLTQDFNLPTYIDAFGNEETALRKAIQSMLNGADHESLDMGGRRVSMTAPLDVQAAVPNRASYAQRRVLRNGQLRAEESPAWTPTAVTSQATYSAGRPFILTNVANVANIRPGSLVRAPVGVGREIYVRSVNIAAQEVTLSQPMYGAEGTQNYTFTRFKFMLDFSGFTKLQYFEIEGVEFQCSNRASGVLMASLGSVNAFRDCFFNRPLHRGITSHGSGCQGLLVDHCQFISGEPDTFAQNRVSVGITANANDVKLRNNRASQMRHFAVLSGTHNVIAGNHFFQGDASPDGSRTAGIVLTIRSVNTSITGNYIDNCFVEWTNERETGPDFTGGFGFAGLTITDNVFLAGSVSSSFSSIVVKPYGTGQFINGLNVSGNTFRGVGAVMTRAEKVDTSFAQLDLSRMKDVHFSNNTFHNVGNASINPAVFVHSQGSAAGTWVVDCSDLLPFGGQARNIDALVARDKIATAGNVARWVMPYVKANQGPQANRVHVVWPEALRGSVRVTVRMDR